MELSINTWWSGLTTIEQSFWIIAITFTVVFLIQLVLSIIGFEAGTDMDNISDDDMDIDSDDRMGFHFISLKNFIAFFTVFGWTGLACIDSGLGTGLTIFISLVAGLVMMLIMATLFYLMEKLTESADKNNTNVEVGQTGTVYLKIPANRNGTGKVQVNASGIKILDAVTDNKEDIKSGSFIRIASVEADNILVVELV